MPLASNPRFAVIYSLKATGWPLSAARLIQIRLTLIIPPGRAGRIVLHGAEELWSWRNLLTGVWSGSSEEPRYAC
jgi:hypothetical protein